MNKIVKRSIAIGCLPMILLFLFFPIILIFAVSSSSSNGND
ncbi:MULTISPECIES: hypothetical protein [unclassified Gemella]|nr:MULTISPECIES: hypothetical protein [unclassified Gemella]